MEKILEIIKKKKTTSLEVGQSIEVTREEKRYRLSVEELKKGVWLDEIPNKQNVEVIFKNGYLSIKDFNSNNKPERR